MVIDPRGTGPYDGLSSYVALAQPVTDFCTASKGCSVFCSFSIYVFSCFISFPLFAVGISVPFFCIVPHKVTPLERFSFRVQFYISRVSVGICEGLKRV